MKWCDIADYFKKCHTNVILYMGVVIFAKVNDKLDMIGYFLRTKKVEGRATIYTRLKRSRPFIILPYISTGIEVDIETWNKATKTAKTWNAFISGEGKELSEMLNSITKIINRLIIDKQVKSNEDKYIIDNAINAIVNNNEYHMATLNSDQQDAREADTIKDKQTLISFYNYFFQGICDGSIRHGNNERYSDGTIIIWKQFGVLLNEYSSPKMTFNDITKAFADDFCRFLEAKNFMPKTINKHIICFRKMCNLAAEEGLNKNAVSLKVWKEKRVKDTEKRTELYLTDDELDALYDMPLSGMKEKVRDIFLLGVFSGQRISDYSRLSRENFSQTVHSTPIIRLWQQKTGTYVEIPYVDPRVDELCQKYNYSFPQLDKRNINKIIKLILAELSSSVVSLTELIPTVLSQTEQKKENNFKIMDTQYKSGQSMDVETKKYYLKLRKYADENNGSPLYCRDSQGRVLKHKYELVSSHTARRSAITNLYKSGLLDSREIMSISGHRTEKAFENYIRVSVSEQADRVYQKMLGLKMKNK